MSDRVTCNISAVQSHRDAILSYYQMQILHFKRLKQKTEGVAWDDKVFEQVIEEINVCLDKISDAIGMITDGRRVRIVDTFLEEARNYVATKGNYPR